MTTEYEPGTYWSERLERHFSLRGTGHAAYSRAYNRWVYRAKERALGRALESAPHRGDALDIGSGTGWCVSRLLERGFTTQGCDITNKSVDTLRQRFPEADFFQLRVGAERIPRDGRTLDLITALDVLYHVKSDDQWAQALAEFSRTLRPSGTLIITDAFAAEDRDPAAHVRFRSAARWRAGAAQARLAVAEVIPLYRWLSRDRGESSLDRLPDGLRGAFEFTLESAWKRPAHMNCVVLRPDS